MFDFISQNDVLGEKLTPHIQILKAGLIISSLLVLTKIGDNSNLKDSIIKQKSSLLFWRTVRGKIVGLNKGNIWEYFLNFRKIKIKNLKFLG